MAAFAACLTLSGVSKSGSPAPRMMTGRPSRFMAAARAPICRILETPTEAIREAGRKPASPMSDLAFMVAYSMSKDTPCASGRALE
jgi:hypothetical protein